MHSETCSHHSQGSKCSEDNANRDRQQQCDDMMLDAARHLISAMGDTDGFLSQSGLVLDSTGLSKVIMHASAMC